MRNITSLHFSHCETKCGPGGTTEIYVGAVFGHFSYLSRAKIKGNRAIPQEIPCLRYQFFATTRSIPSTSWKGCKAIIGLSFPHLAPPVFNMKQDALPSSIRVLDRVSF